MNSTHPSLLLVGILVLCVVPVSGQEWQERPYETEISAAVESILARNPDLRFDTDRMGRSFLYGAPICHGKTDLEAVDRFLEEHAI